MQISETGEAGNDCMEHHSCRSGSKQSISSWGELVCGGLGLLLSAVPRKCLEANMLTQTHSCTHSLLNTDWTFSCRGRAPPKAFLHFISLESNTLGVPSCRGCVCPLECRAGDHARPVLAFPFLNVWYHQALFTGNHVAVSLFMGLQDDVPRGHFLTLNSQGGLCYPGK